MQMLEFVRSNRLPFTWRHPARADDPSAPSLPPGLDASSLPLVRLVGAGPAGRAVYGASDRLDTLIIDSTALGGQAGASRRIANYLGSPAGNSGSELTSRAVTQARNVRRPVGDALRALSLETGNGRHILRLEDERDRPAGSRHARREWLHPPGWRRGCRCGVPLRRPSRGSLQPVTSAQARREMRHRRRRGSNGGAARPRSARSALGLAHRREQIATRLLAATANLRADAAVVMVGGVALALHRRTHDTRRRTPRSLPGRRQIDFGLAGQDAADAVGRCRRSRD